MSPSHQIYFPIAALLIASMACAVPAITTTPDTSRGALNTAIAQTVAALTLNAPTETASPMLEPTSTSTYTLEPPTQTPTETVTATLEFTSTSSITLISVSIPTNCRNGPGKVYGMEGSLLVGEFAEVFGADPTNNYWYIRNPDSGAEFCWVWGKYATLTGPTLQLPIYTPPPTPTATLTPLPTITPTQPPTFNADYVSFDTCNGQGWVHIKLKNTSAILFRSVYVSVKDKGTGETQEQLQNEFSNRDGCAEKITKDVLGTGETYILSSPAFNYDLKGHEIKVTITLCSDTDLKGLCSTRGVGVIP